MKKVLFIAFSFPPYETVGSQRPYRLAKYFPKVGWEPIILTVKRSGRRPQGIKVIDTDYIDIVSYLKSIIGLDPTEGFHDKLGIVVSKNYDYPTWKSKAIKLLKEVVNYPDYARGWYKLAFEAASEYLLHERVDVIISTSAPVTSHLIARQLKKKHKIPWIADLRDLWTQNHFYSKFDLIKHFERRLELKTLSDADLLVTVTERFADELNTLHKNRKVFCVTNGFDEDDFSKLTAELTNKFIITHAGMLYNGKRDPSVLFNVISLLIMENKINKDLLEIRFYGPKEEWLMEEIKKYNLEGVVSSYGFIPREEVLRRQRESQILLLLLDSENKEEGVYPAKVFEYFGARRPIIAIGGNGGNIKELLKENNAGFFAESSGALKTILLRYYEEFLESGEVRYYGNENIRNYTYESITKRYSEFLNYICLTNKS